MSSVTPADAFLATLSDEQKDTVLYDFGDAAKKTGWSNFPIPIVERNGLKFGDLTDEQEVAALKVMEAALSKKGYPGQFTVQYGGHHAAYDITYAGKNVSISPTLTAVEPMEFDWEEMYYAPSADKRDGTIGAIQSLTETELAAAEIDGSFDDLDEKAAARLLAKYVSEYDETYIGWSGGTTLDNTQTYVRLDGPSAWIEFSNQPGPETGGVHQHTVFRDKTSDYGWEWPDQEPAR